MVLIFTEHNDESTIKVIDWLHFNFNSTHLRINTDKYKQDFEVVNLDINKKKISFSFNRQIYDSESIKSVWFRRGFLQLSDEKQKISNELNDVRLQVYAFLRYEKTILSDYINFIFQNKISVGKYYLQDINKLFVLEIAKSVKIKIPSTKIFTKKKLLSEYIKNKTVITKSIAANLFINSTSYKLFSYTSIFNENHISLLTDTFPPSIIQSYIDKKYEIRVFYLKGKCYSMAIFSQQDEQTKVDFRNYNYSKPNRRVPYLLPNILEKKIDKLMVRLGLDTGSIDIVVDQKNQFYFLEVNPVGQFGMVSHPCNYFLEKEIAKILVHK